MLINIDVYVDYISGFIFAMVQKYESAHTVCRHSLFAFFKNEDLRKQKTKNQASSLLAYLEILSLFVNF